MKIRTNEIIKILYKEYPKEEIALDFRNPLQLLVATVLSAQCTDDMVNKVTKRIFKKYKAVKDYAQARQSTFEKEIRSTGFYRNKAKNIIKTAQILLSDYKGKVPDTMQELLKLPGVARKTANIVLYSGFGKIEGIAVDTHVKRISQRLNLTKNSDPNKIEQDLMRLFDKKDWGRANHLLVVHGRRVCIARKPKCLECKLRSICTSKSKFHR